MSPNIESRWPPTEETLVLARLAHTLTVCARDTYEAGTENVLEPQVLRAYNELLHRVTAAGEHLAGKRDFSLKAILSMTRAFGEQHNRVKEMEWAIKRETRDLKVGGL